MAYTSPEKKRGGGGTPLNKTAKSGLKTGMESEMGVEGKWHVLV